MRSNALEDALVAKQANWTDAEKAFIADELQTILANPRFSSSQRCAKLLHHLVRHMLDGDCERLKERTLGIEVFGRDANYDTSTDPVVRITASEIRKRLALYYQEPAHTRSVRIQLAPGGYLPTFEFGLREQLVEGDEAAAVEALSPQGTETEARPKTGRLANLIRNKRILLWVGAVIVVAAGAFAAYRADTFQSTGYLVWKPLVYVNRDIAVCISDSPPPMFPPRLGPFPMVTLEDARTTFKLSSLLQQLGRRAILHSSSELTMKDFRGAPIVLIGGLNNPWSETLLSSLRYRIRRDAVTGENWIEDSQAPSNHAWSMSVVDPHSTVDYAILTRYRDPETGGWIMAMSGLGTLGTEAAADLITAPRQVGSLPAILRTSGNFQVVLKATVVNGAIGSPQILAVHTW